MPARPTCVVITWLCVADEQEGACGPVLRGSQQIPQAGKLQTGHPRRNTGKGTIIVQRRLAVPQGTVCACHSMCRRATLDVLLATAPHVCAHLSPVPLPLQALAFAQEVYGPQSLEMVPAYLLLSQANLGLGRLQSVEELLGLANWVVLRNPDCSNAIHSHLHRNFGKLYKAQGKVCLLTFGTSVLCTCLIHMCLVQAVLT
jgi:hypothetical protein